ncbi:unnamed protein product [Owenia fusiformis]|uniref:Cytochrome b5 heme-binding domain-containing protein n=1 Tax=Owenia fusiformis TaxID=6347 RepID=A0A8S4P4L4_OWEFU|nr:unnamed protein product [Owenia fusiformis]
MRHLAIGTTNSSILQGLYNQAYDITTWARRHPGGSKVISHYAGQDASEAFRAFHPDLNHVKKFLKPIELGPVIDENHTEKEKDLIKDMDELNKTAEKMGLFKPSVTFFTLHLAHILALEAAAFLVMYYFGTGWIPFITSCILFGTMEAQAAWTQHDYGHVSVFKSVTLNHLLHHFTMGFLKGASPDWWRHMHYQHHAKPNVMDKDPDVRLDQLFVVGQTMPIKVAKKGDSKMPYNLQHNYFFALGPPLLFPVFFQIMTIRHIIKRRLWKDALSTFGFYVKLLVLYYPMLGFWWTLAFYEITRIIESHWFTWVSQSNHIPMEIEEDRAEAWLPLQLHATCDIEKSFFNDWFTGHLNFQIEHHLFPRMPRHNLYKVAPLVKSLCEKYGVKYQVKSLGTAFVDIVKSLKNSGELWEAACHAHHIN